MSVRQPPLDEADVREMLEMWFERRERNGAVVVTFDATQKIRALADDWLRLKTIEEAQKKALLRYGHHHNRCPAIDRPFKVGACTCGFAAALGSESERTTE